MESSCQESVSNKPSSDNKEKIEILLKATGNAPILKTKKWMVEKEKTVAAIIEFLRKLLKLEPTDSLFLYVNQAFAPSPDQTMKNLYDCYNTNGRIILHYCRTQAWG
ncbi:ubiquitin-like protein ATG12 [Daktulosphaira vitifoliae]|uniref:ubiquitin-like protein ATG12 n=1 Tax=Daktulosphaira vitifoliae TaxID=58002 RepID=UPI0021AAC040|nr:ubiquitin-like protein ATG12 [Daktulosphaira vitifoliae]